MPLRAPAGRRRKSPFQFRLAYLREAARRVSLPVLFLLLVVAVYAGPLFFRRNFGGWDLSSYNLPMEKVTHEAYRRGSLPVWNPHVSGGRAHLPNPNVGAFYPLRPLLALFPFPLAMRIFPLLHWAAAGIGMLMLLRSSGLSRAAAWVGSVTYAFSGVSISYVSYPNLHPGMSLLPWILWIVARRGMARMPRTLVLSVLLALDLLAADIFTIAVAIACSALWIFLEEERPARRPALAVLGASLALAGLLAAPQILATALWIPETNRAVLGLKLQTVLLFSLPLPRLLEFIVPFPAGAIWAIEDARIWGWRLFHMKMRGLFVTLFAGSFAIIALFASWRGRGRGCRFARALFLAGLAVTVLPSFLPSGWNDRPSPVPLRYPEKFAVVLVFSLAILSAHALDGFRRSAAVPRWSLGVGILLASLAGATALFPSEVGRLAAALLGEPRFPKIAADELPRALAEGGMLWAATILAIGALAWRARAGLATALVLLTLVPICANRKIAAVFREEELFAPTPFAWYLSRKDPAGAYRTLDQAVYRPPSPIEQRIAGSDPGLLALTRRDWADQTHALWGRGTVLDSDLDVGDFSRMESLRRWVRVSADALGRTPLYGSLSLRWGVRFQDQRPVPGYEKVGGDLVQAWGERRDALPDIRLAEAWREEGGALAALRALPTLRAGEIVLETGSGRRGNARPGKVRVLQRSPERLRIAVEAPDPTWLFVLRGYWRHRAVLLDGAAVEPVPAQLAFTAVAVPAGVHAIDWRERVPGGNVSRWGPVLYCLIVLLLFSRASHRPAAV